jgi:hypothetical protein
MLENLEFKTHSQSKYLGSCLINSYLEILMPIYVWTLHDIKFLWKYRHVLLYFQIIWYKGWNWFWKFGALVIHMEL